MLQKESLKETRNKCDIYKQVTVTNWIMNNINSSLLIASLLIQKRKEKISNHENQSVQFNSIQVIDSAV